MEIIAKKNKLAASIFIACIVIGAICGVGMPVLLAVFYFTGQAELDAFIACGITCLIAGLGFLVVGIIMERKMRRLPQRIVRDGQNLDFGNGLVCTADKIENVTFEKYGKRGSNRTYSYGRLTVQVDGAVIEYEFIANVEEAHDRLVQLMREAANNNTRT